MVNLLCNNCQNQSDAKDIYVCYNCGSFVCDNCQKQNGGLCPHCYEKLSKLS